MIIDLFNRTLDIFVSNKVTFSQNICHSFKVTLAAIFLALSTLLAIRASFNFLTFSIVYQRYS